MPTPNGNPTVEELLASFNADPQRLSAFVIKTANVVKQRNELLELATSQRELLDKVTAQRDRSTELLAKAVAELMELRSEAETLGYQSMN